MLLRPALQQKPEMDRIILIACSVLLASFYSVVVLATPRYESVSELGKFKEDEKRSEMVLTPRLGRRKRNLRDETYTLTEEELPELWDVFWETPTALITFNGNEKLVCKTMQVKPAAPEFIPRLGRNLEDSVRDKWLRDALSAEVDERSPPFAPRLGRRLSPYSPRLGREV